MNSILNEFKIFDSCPEDMKSSIKIFYVQKSGIFDNQFGICITNEDQVFAFALRSRSSSPNDFKFRESFIDNYMLISGLCDQDIEEFFCFEKHFFAKSADNKVFVKNTKKDDWQDYFKVKLIEYFNNKKIIDISCGYSHCLALSSEGLVYGWGDNKKGQFNDLNVSQIILTSVLINSVFGEEKRVKHIHCFGQTSVFVSFEGIVYILNPQKNHLEYKITEFCDIHKIYLKDIYDSNNVLILRNNGNVEYFSSDLRKSIKFNVDNLFDSNYYSGDLIVPDDDRIQIVDIDKADLFYFNSKSAFEYHLFNKLTTYTTIHIQKEQIYHKVVKFDEISKSFNESIIAINFDLQEYRNKYYNPDDKNCLEKFKISNVLPKILESKVKFYHQIGFISSSVNSGIFVMNDNKVYGIGCNRGGVLGLGHEQKVTEYTLIKDFWDQNIEEFFEGGLNISDIFMFARNDKNQIFSWGGNLFGQLAREIYYLTPKKIDYFDDKNIIEISCGSYHCLALSNEGIIYGWGNNQNGQTGNRNILPFDHRTPKKVEFNDSLDNRIKYIQCFSNTSCAVTIDGRAYIWGKMNERKSVIPILIETNVSKMFLNWNSKFSVLSNDGIFKIGKYFGIRKAKRNKYGDFQMLMDSELGLDTDITLEINSEINGVFDIHWYDEITKDGIVSKVEEYGGYIGNTNYSNYFEYSLYIKRRIFQTIHITSDGYLMRPIIELNVGSDENLLIKKLVNIFDRKYENSFEFIEKVGEGGFGVVNKVKNISTSEIFAIKILQIKGNFSETLKEIQIMSELNSEYVVKYYNSWTEAKFIDKEIINYVYIQMELCSQNLKFIIDLMNTYVEKRFNLIKYFSRRKILVEIIECLNYLHSSKPPIIHRDLKPQNILINNALNGKSLKLCDFGLTLKGDENTGNTYDVKPELKDDDVQNHQDCRAVKLCDFGLSKFCKVSQNTRGVGTFRYMAPEVLDEDGEEELPDKISRYNEKCDIYSLGVIAEELFELNESNENIRKMHDIDKYLIEYKNTVHEEKFRQVFEITALMLSKRPEERPNCSELLTKTHEWTVDTNIIKSDEYYEEFISLCDTNNKLRVLKSFV